MQSRQEVKDLSQKFRRLNLKSELLHMIQDRIGTTTIELGTEMDKHETKKKRKKERINCTKRKIKRNKARKNKNVHLPCCVIPVGYFYIERRQV